VRGFTLIEILIVVAIVGILIAVGVGAVFQNDAHKKFLAECAHDHKPYECEVMWKQMHPDQTVVYVRH